MSEQSIDNTSSKKLITNDELKAEFGDWYSVSGAKCPTSEQACNYLSHGNNAKYASISTSSGEENTKLFYRFVANIRTFNVKFFNGNVVLSDQWVSYGGNATEPGTSGISGFINWDKSFTNITQNINVYAIIENTTNYAVKFKSIKCSEAKIAQEDTVRAGTTIGENNITTPNTDIGFNSDYFSVAKWVDTQDNSVFDTDTIVTRDITYQCSQIKTLGHFRYPLVTKVNTGGNDIVLSDDRDQLVNVTLTYNADDEATMNCIVHFPATYANGTKTYTYKGWDQLGSTCYLYYNTTQSQWAYSKSSPSVSTPIITVNVDQDQTTESVHSLSFQWPYDYSGIDYLGNVNTNYEDKNGNWYDTGNNKLAANLINDSRQRCYLLSVFLDSAEVKIYEEGEIINVECSDSTIRMRVWYNIFQDYSQITTSGYIDTETGFGGEQLYKNIQGEPFQLPGGNGVIWYDLTNASGDLNLDTLYLARPKRFVRANGESISGSVTVKFFIELQNSNGGSLGEYVYEYPDTVQVVGTDPNIIRSDGLKPQELVNFQSVNSSGPSMISVLGKPLAIVMCKVI